VLPDGPAAATFAPGSPALEIHPEARPAAAEPVMTKHLPGSFTGTDLERWLREQGVDRVIVSGFMTQMCVDTTARQAAHLGFGVCVLADATAAMAVKAPDGAMIAADQVHRTHLGSLSGFLAQIARVDDLVA
jgi:nicotinamidase-related amidase